MRIKKDIEAITISSDVPVVQKLLDIDLNIPEGYYAKVGSILLLSSVSDDPAGNFSISGSGWIGLRQGGVAAASEHPLLDGNLGIAPVTKMGNRLTASATTSEINWDPEAYLVDEDMLITGVATLNLYIGSLATVDTVTWPISMVVGGVVYVDYEMNKLTTSVASKISARCCS